MSEEKKHIIYTAADIKRYLGGEMLPAEMHAIELAALDDPFLAEAMEGYEIIEEKDYRKELLLLKQNLDNKEDTSPVIPISKAPAYKWWRAAAAVLVIGCTVATAYIFTSKKETAGPTEIAKLVTPATLDSNTVVVESNKAAMVDSASVSSNILSSDAATAGTFKVTEQQQQYIGTLSQASKDSVQFASLDRRSKADSAFIYTPSAVNGNNGLAHYDYSPGTDDESKKMKEVASATIPANAANVTYSNEVTVDNNAFLKKEAGKYKNNQNGLTASNDFYAQVVTPDNKPVSFANVMVPQNKKPVLTDANGRFRVKAPDTTVKVTVVSAGYNSQKFTLQNSIPQNTIVLQPQDVATEKVTAAAGVKRLARKQVTVADSTAEDEEEDYAEPSGGWAEYNNYLNNNLVVPSEAKSKNIHGEVEVFVKLNSNGEVRQVKVAKPLCAQCDAEAVRLVKEGPKFELKKNKTKKVKVKVTF